MQVKPTLDGMELCFQNSLRLFEDSCTEGLSLPTVGAILEIGLEEAAKGFLILSCLKEIEAIPPKRKINLDKSLSDFIVKVREFNNNIDCQKHLDLAFSRHEVKTNILNFFGNLFPLVSLGSDTMKNLTKDFFKGFNPNISDDFVEKQLSSRSVTEFISKNMNATGSVLKGMSGKIKESGLYVDWTGSCFRYPEIDNNTILRMAGFLYTVIISFKTFTELFKIKLQTKLDIRYLHQKLTALEGRLK